MISSICKFYELSMKKNHKLHYSIIPLSFCVGVVSIFAFMHFFGWNKLEALLSILLILAFLLLALVLKGYFRLLFSFLLGVAAGYIRGQSYYSGIDLVKSYQGHEIVFEARVESDPIIKKDALRFESSSLLLEDKSTAISCPAYFSLSDTSLSISKSDKLLLGGKNSGSFGSYCAFFNKPEILKISKPDPPNLSLMLRDWFSERLISIIDGEKSSASDASALGLGFLTGQKSYISSNFNEQLRRAGLSHIVVASGFHLAIVVSLARKFFSKISRFATIFGACLLIICFVSITGLSASMLRATFLALLSLITWYFGRKIHPARAILYVASFSLFVNPGNIANLAWQLSFASYIGIIFLAPLILGYFYEKDSPSFIANTCIQSISAQLMCLPLSIYNFGAFSIVGLISNLLIPPAIPITMLLSLLSVLFAWVPYLSDVLAMLAKALLEFQVYIIRALSNLSWASPSIDSNDARIFLFYLIPVAIFIFLRLITKHSFHPYKAKIATRAKLEKS